MRDYLGGTWTFRAAIAPMARMAMQSMCLGVAGDQVAPRATTARGLTKAATATTEPQGGWAGDQVAARATTARGLTKAATAATDPWCSWPFFWLFPGLHGIPSNHLLVKQGRGQKEDQEDKKTPEASGGGPTY